MSWGDHPASKPANRPQWQRRESRCTLPAQQQLPLSNSGLGSLPHIQTPAIAAAVAIAMHNIPEGICVAMPIYYATGSKWKVGGGLGRCRRCARC